jgi:hypothetical protein
MPFEFADGKIRDITHGTAKDLVSIARAVAQGRADAVVERARRVVADLRTRELARSRRGRSPR